MAGRVQEPLKERISRLTIEMYENRLDATRNHNMNHLKEHKNRTCGPWPPEPAGWEPLISATGEHRSDPIGL
jgi:hypothetical protein